MSDFDDIFGDEPKESQALAPTLTSSALFGVSPMKPSENTNGSSINPPQKAVPAPVVVAAPSAPSPGPIATPSAASTCADDDFLSWLDDKPSGASSSGSTGYDSSAYTSSYSSSTYNFTSTPNVGSLSLDDDDDDLEKLIANASKPAPSAKEYTTNQQKQEETFDIPALTKKYFETGSIPATARLFVWKEALQASKGMDSVTMYAVQTTPLDLQNQALLRKEVESICSQIFSSTIHSEVVQASGSDDVDSSQLMFIDNAEILLTFVCKKLNMDYRSGFAMTFAPLIAIGGSDPLRMEVVHTLLGACNRLLPHLSKNIPTWQVAEARRPLMKYLLLYHAPQIAFHLDQHYHNWVNAGEQDKSQSNLHDEVDPFGGALSVTASSAGDTNRQMNGILMDSWVASMFESESHGFDYLLRVWDTCVMAPSSNAATSGSTLTYPSTVMCFVAVYVILKAEKKLMRMEGDQLKACMMQTLQEVLKDNSDKLINGVQTLMDATPPGFCHRLREAGLHPEAAQRSTAVAASSTKPTSSTPNAANMNAGGKGFSLLSATTNGMKEMSSMMINMPNTLLQMVPTGSSGSNSSNNWLKDEPSIYDLCEQLTRQASTFCVPLAPMDVIPSVFRSFQQPSGDKIRYFIIDCRAVELLQVEGSIPTAFHFDPDAVTDPAVLDRVLATLNPMKTTVHFVVMGHGFAPIEGKGKVALRDDLIDCYAQDLGRLSTTVLFLTKRGFPHVSVLDGGFVAAHKFLYNSRDPAVSLQDLIDHDSNSCEQCQQQAQAQHVGASHHHHHHHAPTPVQIFQQSTTTPSSDPTPTDVRTGSIHDFLDASSMQTASYHQMASTASSTTSSFTSNNPASTSSSTSSHREIDAKSLFGAHTNAGSSGGAGGYFSLTGALKSGKNMIKKADNKLSDVNKTLGIPNFSKLRDSLSHLGAESIDQAKKHMYMGGGTAHGVGAAKASATSGSHGNAAISKQEMVVDQKSDAVFSIDDDEEEEADDFVGGSGNNKPTASSNSGNGSRNSSFSSSSRNSSFDNGAATNVSALHSVMKGQVKELKKGMRVSRTQLMPFLESPFFSGYKKKANASDPNARASMLPRHLVLAENCVIVFKAEKHLEDVYIVKSCHHLTHVARMTCLKKNALMVTVYYRYKKPTTSEIIEKKNAYEIQQRDNFIKVVKTAMEKM